MSLTIDSHVSQFIQYVEEKNLYNSFNKMLIQCDDLLKKILGVDSFAFFGLERILKLQKEKEKQQTLDGGSLSADDRLSLEEIAAKILANLHTMPIDLSGSVIEKDSDSDSSDSSDSDSDSDSSDSDSSDSDSDSDSSDSTPTYEYEEQSSEEDAEYTNHDEFQVLDRNSTNIHFQRYDRNGVRLIKINGYLFEGEELLNYVKHLMDKEVVIKQNVFNDGMIVGLLTSFLMFTFFSLWLSLVNYGLNKIN